MQDQIEMLSSIQKVDIKIREKEQNQRKLQNEIDKREKEIATVKAEVEALRNEWSEKDKLRQERENKLQEDGKQAMEKRMRMNRIKNIKELQALQREIDQIKQSNSQLEEELIQLLEALEAQDASVKEKEAKLQELTEQWSSQKAELELQVAELQSSVAEAFEARKALIERVDKTLIERYELIFSRRGGMAVVPVTNGICQGCYMNIPPQLYNEILKSETVKLCPSCNRILFAKQSLPDEKQL